MSRSPKNEYENIVCPICGSHPHMMALDEFSEYKLSCPHHHLDCGDWKRTKEDAWADYLKRIKDTSQPDFCFNDNHFTVQQMDLSKMADFLFRFQRGDFKLDTKEKIEEWLNKPIDGIYPKGYPGVPLELQSADTDIYAYRKRQAAHKI